MIPLELTRRSLMLGSVALALVAGLEARGSPSIAQSRVDALLARARSGLNKRTRYRIDVAPPSPLLPAWPVGIKADCSGFVAWCFGLGRYPPELHGYQLFTDSIVEDALLSTANRFFVRSDRPVIGGIVAYPWYRDEAGDRKAGHIAIVTDVRSQNDYDILDCSKSAFLDPKIKDAIVEARDTKFEAHRMRLAGIRASNPAWPTSSLRDPIFARPAR